MAATLCARQMLLDTMQMWTPHHHKQRAWWQCTTDTTARFSTSMPAGSVKSFVGAATRSVLLIALQGHFENSILSFDSLISP